jgi:hypothetical protein
LIAVFRVRINGLGRVVLVTPWSQERITYIVEQVRHALRILQRVCIKLHFVIVVLIRIEETGSICQTVDEFDPA